MRLRHLQLRQRRVKMGRKRPVSVIATVGVPASGKSTWARELCAKDPGWVRIGRDDFRYMFRNVGFDPLIESLVTKAHDAAVVAALTSGKSVVLDNTHCRRAYLNDALELVKHYADASVKYFPIDPKEAIARDSARERAVGAQVIEKMHADLSKWAGEFDFGAKHPKQPRPHTTSTRSADLPNAVVFDIDGTLALMGDRSPFDWARVGVDLPNLPVVERARDHFEHSDDAVILVSGRDGSCEAETRAWLAKHGVPFDALHMRPAGDFRKDTLIKREIYDTHIAGKFNVLAVYDDRPSVVDMWHGLGLFVFNCQQGRYEF